jgi:hypothetical protein
VALRRSPGTVPSPAKVAHLLGQLGLMAARAARDADQLDAAQVQAEAERLGAAVDRLLAGQTIYPGRPCHPRHRGRGLRAEAPPIPVAPLVHAAGVQSLAQAGRSGVRIAALPVAWPSHLSQKSNPTV